MANARRDGRLPGPLLWLGAVAVARSSPGRAVGRAHHRQLEALGPGRHRAALVGAVCMRVAFYNLGLSVFMFY